MAPMDVHTEHRRPRRSVAEQPGESIEGVIDQRAATDRAEDLRALEGERAEPGARSGPQDHTCDTVGMDTRRWINQSQPQTLVNATLLLYLNAAFTALLGGLFSLIGLVLVAGGVAAGFGIANEQRWGYQLGLGMAFAPFVLRFAFGGLGAVFGISVISLLFEIVLVALLLHDQSREYQRIWFR